MPIVDLTPQPITGITGRPEGFAVTPGKDELDHGSDTPELTPLNASFGSTLFAAFRQGNIMGSSSARQDWGANLEKEPGFNPWDAIKGTKYEEHWGSFTDIRSTAGADARKRQIDMEDEDRKTLAAAPFWSHSLPATLLAGTADITSLVPGAAFVKGAAGGISIARTAAATGLAAGAAVTGQEIGLHATQELRTGAESAVNIGASTFLGGLLGAAGAKLLSHAEWNASVAALNRDLGKSESSPAKAYWDAYHGTTSGVPFEKFDLDRGGALRSNEAGVAFFSPTPELAEKFTEHMSISAVPEDTFAAEAGPRIYPVKIDPGKTHTFDAREMFINDPAFREEMRAILPERKHALIEKWLDGAKTGPTVDTSVIQAIIPRAKQMGLDTARVTGLDEGEHIMVLNADQIRSRYSLESGGASAPASVGAAAHEPVSLEGNTIAGRTAGAVAAATKKLNPLLRIMQSPSAAVRDIGGKLFENSLYLKKNFEGVASEPAVETLMKEWNGGLVKAITSMDGAFSDYAKAGGPLKYKEFKEAVGRAMRRGDEDPDPHVAAVAKAWRSQVFDPLKEAAIKAGLLPEDVSVETATSYFSRMWNRNRLIGQEGQFKQIVSEHYNDVIGKEYEKATVATKARVAKLDQEIQDLTLSPEGREQKLAEVETKLRTHEEAGEAYQGLTGQADRLGELAAEMRRAKDAGDDAARAAAKTEADAIRKSGGAGLKTFMQERANLRQRRSNIDLGAAGLAERSQRILETMADIEEATQRTLGRLVKKGQALERGLDKLDPDMLAERISGMKDAFAELARRSDGAAERATKAVEKMREGAEKARESGAVLGAEAGQKMDEAVAARLQKEAAAHRARSERMSKIAERLDLAEGFDREGAVAELRAGIEKAVAETSDTTLGRGERAQRMKERLAALDPERIKERVKAAEQMKKEALRGYYDRWEIKNLGQGVDLFHPEGQRPNFSDAARDIADNVYNTLTGRTEAGVRPEFMTVGTRGPMKDRTFNIPDAKIEDFLEHDVDHVGRRYVRVMGADVEMAHKFGSVDMKDQIAEIRANYDRMRSGLPDGPERLKLDKAERSDIDDMSALRDLMRGTRAESPIERDYAKIARVAGHFNYIRQMGEVVPGSLNDAVRPAMVHGLLPYMQTVGQLATNLKAVKMSVEEAKIAGNVAERVLAHRMATLTDIADPYASRGPVEAFLENMSNFASKWNGIRLWTDMQKSITAVMTQNRILQGVEKFATTKDRPYLALLGIDESVAERIQAQFVAHGENIDGVRVAKTETWTDPVAVRTYRAAMNKDIDSIIVQSSKADVPLFAHTPTGKMFLQFQSFNLASHQRVMMRGLQEAPSRFIGGSIGMTAMGMFITWVKAVSGNRTEKLEDITSNPGWWIGEGLDRSGIIPVPMELANRMEKITGLNPIKGVMKLADKGSAESQKNQNRNDFGSMLGPTFGLGQDIATVAGIPKSIYEGKDVAKAQKNAGERLLPFNSYFGLRQALRYVVNPQH